MHDSKYHEPYYPPIPYQPNIPHSGNPPISYPPTSYPPPSTYNYPKYSGPNYREKPYSYPEYPQNYISPDRYYPEPYHQSMPYYPHNIYSNPYYPPYEYEYHGTGSELLPEGSRLMGSRIVSRTLIDPKTNKKFNLPIHIPESEAISRCIRNEYPEQIGNITEGWLI